MISIWCDMFYKAVISCIIIYAVIGRSLDQLVISRQTNKNMIRMSKTREFFFQHKISHFTNIRHMLKSLIISYNVCKILWIIMKLTGMFPNKASEFRTNTILTDKIVIKLSIFCLKFQQKFGHQSKVRTTKVEPRSKNKWSILPLLAQINTQAKGHNHYLSVTFLVLDCYVQSN